MSDLFKLYALVESQFLDIQQYVLWILGLEVVMIKLSPQILWLDLSECDKGEDDDSSEYQGYQVIACPNDQT